MNRLQYSMLSVLLLGVILLSVGALMFTQTKYGPITRFWTGPTIRVPANSITPTWGVGGNATQEPDEWHFEVFFTANRTATIKLVWNLNESLLYEKTSAAINESFSVALPKASGDWRWDWAIHNSQDSALGVQNFTVIHYSIQHPQRQIGILMLSGGIIAVIAASIALVYLRIPLENYLHSA
jgi:hypothetical protein